MRKIAAILLIISSCLSCSTMPKMPKLPRPPKTAPLYTGVDPLLKPYYDEYISLAKAQGITFQHQVTMGFMVIDDGNYVGICTRNGIMGFREIDVDSPYWVDAGNERKKILTFHELTHCFCGRDHDYGDGKFYPEPDLGAVFTIIKEMAVVKTAPVGLYDDQCPISLMYPNVIPPECFNLHYNDYIKEMFDRCDPW